MTGTGAGDIAAEERLQPYLYPARTISTLRRRQNEHGSFGYWAADNSSSIDFVSVYVMHFLIEAKAAGPLADALEVTWRRDPGLYYEDGYQELADRGGQIAAAPIGAAVDWVEVDNHDDLRRAREIAPRC